MVKPVKPQFHILWDFFLVLKSSPANHLFSFVCVSCQSMPPEMHSHKASVATPRLAKYLVDRCQIL